MSFKTKSGKTVASRRARMTETSNGIGFDVMTVQQMIDKDFSDLTFTGLKVDIRSYDDDEGDKAPSFTGVLVFEDGDGNEVEAVGSIPTGQSRDETLGNTSAPLHNHLLEKFNEEGGFEGDDEDVAEAVANAFVSALRDGVDDEEVMVGDFEDTLGEVKTNFFVGKKSISTAKLVGADLFTGGKAKKEGGKKRK